MAIEMMAPQRDLRQPDRRRASMDALWRLSGWGGAAALALVALAATTQTEVGGERLQLALAIPTEPARVVAELPPRPPEKDAETRALEAQVRALAVDRDRLATRLASLERHLDDVTGSIQRQAAQPAPAPAAQPAPAPVASAPASAPQPAPVASMAPSPSSKVDVASITPPIDPLAMPPGSEGAGSWPDAGLSQAAAPPLTESKEIVALPPARLAALPANGHMPSHPAAPRHEYGIELAIAPDIETLRTRWAAVKANYGPLLAGLQPIAVRDTRPGSTSYRLIAGPVPNLAAARQACMRFTAARAVCRPARFTGDAVVQR